MKKVSFIAIVGAAGLMSSAAFAAGGGVAISNAQGVNIGSQTQIGVNNVQGQIQGVTSGHIDTINNLSSLTTFQADGEVHLDPHAFSIGSIIESGNGAAGGNADASVTQATLAKVETEVHEGILIANKGGEIGGGKALGANLAHIDNVTAGAGGAGAAASISSTDSNNITIDNTSTSTADFHTATFTKIEVGNIEANVAVGGAVATRGGIVNGDGVVVTDSGNGNTVNPAPLP